MEIRENKYICIIAPLSVKIEKYKIECLSKKIEKETRKIAIDLKYVQDCTIDFIDFIKSLSNKDISFFNIHSDIFVLFNIMNLDKSVKLFVSEIDFEEDNRQIINRQFKLVS